jgi:hypothetical protein
MMLILLASVDAGEEGVWKYMRINKTWIAMNIYQASPNSNQQSLPSIYILVRSTTDFLRINLPFTHSHGQLTSNLLSQKSMIRIQCPTRLVHQSASPIPLSMKY